MKYQELHSWDMTEEEARAQQAAMRGLVSLEDNFGEIKTMAGVGLSFDTKKNEAMPSSSCCLTAYNKASADGPVTIAPAPTQETLFL